MAVDGAGAGGGRDAKVDCAAAVFVGDAAAVFVGDVAATACAEAVGGAADACCDTAGVGGGPGAAGGDAAFAGSLCEVLVERRALSLNMP